MSKLQAVTLLTSSQLNQIWAKVDGADPRLSKHFNTVQASQRHDGAGTIFVTKQLTYLESIIHNLVEKDLVYNQVFPVSFEGGEGLESIEYQTGMATGTAKQIGNDGKFERVGYKEQSYPKPVRPYGLEYAVSYDDMVKAQRANANLSQKLVNATNRGMEEAVNNCAFNGDGALDGVFTNLANLTNVTFEADGASSSRKLRDKDAQKIERDIKALKAAVASALGGAMSGGMTYTLVLSPLDYEHVIATKSYNVGGDGGLIPDYLSKIGITKIVSSADLTNNTKLGNKDGVLLVPQSNAVCEFKIPQAKKALPVYWDGWNWVTKYKLDCSGLHLYLPKKIGYTSY